MNRDRRNALRFSALRRYILNNPTREDIGVQHAQYAGEAGERDRVEEYVEHEERR